MAIKPSDMEEVLLETAKASLSRENPHIRSGRKEDEIHGRRAYKRRP